MRRALGGILATIVLLASCESATEPPAPAIEFTLEAVTGTTPQTGAVFSTAAVVPTVRVVDASGKPQAGVPVAFTISRGTGSVGQERVTTDATGIASPGSWTFGAYAGAQQLLASLPMTHSGQRITFDGTATPAVATRMIVTPDTQSIVRGDSGQVTVVFKDAGGNLTNLHPTPVLTSSDLTRATVTSSGRVAGVLPGFAEIRVAAGAFLDTVSIAISAGAPTLAVSTFAGIGSNGIAMSSAGFAYLIHSGFMTLHRFDIATRTMTDSIQLPAVVRDVTVLPSGARAYVALENSSVAILDVATSTVLRTVALPNSPMRVLASPDGAYVYASTEDGYTARINTTTDAVQWVITPGTLNGIALSVAGDRLFTTGTEGGVFSINTATFTLTSAVFPLGIPQGVAVTPGGDRIYVAREGAGLDVRRAPDLARLTVTTTTLQNAFTVAVVPGGDYLLVVSATQGTISVVDAYTLQIYRTIDTGLHPRRIGFDPATGDAWITSDEGAVTRIVF